MTTPTRPLTDDEIEGVIAAVTSVFRKLTNLWRAVTPVFTRYGFAPPSPGVMARELSERLEVAVVQHVATFTKGEGFADLSRHGERWEVKVCRDSGLTINQCAMIQGEHYLVVNYRTIGDAVRVARVWVLWGAADDHFTPRRANSNARAVRMAQARPHQQVLLTRRAEDF